MACERPPQGWSPFIHAVLSEFNLSQRVSAETLVSLGIWFDRVLTWNRVLDLTAAQTPEELVDLLIADAAALVHAAGPESDETWVDLGSGAGAPGIGLSLLVPHMRMILVEPKTKRVAFLRSVLGELGRADIEVRRCRAEQLPDAIAHSGVSRAVWAPELWLSHGARLARNQIWVLTTPTKAPEHPGWVVHKQLVYHWPLSRKPRQLLGYHRASASTNSV